jgi:Domain of Unknown Function (DUF928)
MNENSRALQRSKILATIFSLCCVTQWGTSARAVMFEPPGDVAPAQTAGGASRGRVSFTPPGDTAPAQTSGGASRGRLSFTPPGDPAPTRTLSGSSRGVTFEAPGDPSPSSEQSSDGGASRSTIDPTANSTTQSIQQAPDSAADDRPDALINTAIALLPETEVGRTVEERPTFFVYLPETASRKVFFSLLDDRRNSYYQTFIEISGERGIVSFQLPEDAPPLEIGKNYEWYFAIVEGEKMRPDSPTVSGWVKRVAPSASLSDRRASQDKSGMTLELVRAYGLEGIWYDTLSSLVELKRLQPNNPNLNSEWTQLLEQVGLDSIAVNRIVPLEVQPE